MVKHLKMDVKDVSDNLKHIEIPEEEGDEIEEYSTEVSSMIIERVI